MDAKTAKNIKGIARQVELLLVCEQCSTEHKEPAYNSTVMEMGEWADDHGWIVTDDELLCGDCREDDDDA